MISSEFLSHGIIKVMLLLEMVGYFPNINNSLLNNCMYQSVEVIESGWNP